MADGFPDVAVLPQNTTGNSDAVNLRAPHEEIVIFPATVFRCFGKPVQSLAQVAQDHDRARANETVPEKVAKAIPRCRKVSAVTYAQNCAAFVDFFANRVGQRIFGMRLHVGYLHRQFFRFPAIVGIQKRHVFSCCHPQSLVSNDARMSAVFPAVENSRPSLSCQCFLHLRKAPIGGGVIHDDEFPVGITLRQDAPQALAHEPFLVVHPYNDADHRTGFRSPACSFSGQSLSRTRSFLTRVLRMIVFHVAFLSSPVRRRRRKRQQKERAFPSVSYPPRGA